HARVIPLGRRLPTARPLAIVAAAVASHWRQIRSSTIAGLFFYGEFNLLNCACARHDFPSLNSALLTRHRFRREMLRNKIVRERRLEFVRATVHGRRRAPEIVLRSR